MMHRCKRVSAIPLAQFQTHGSSVHASNPLSALGHPNLHRRCLSPVRTTPELDEQLQGAPTHKPHHAKFEGIGSGIKCDAYRVRNAPIAGP